ncbi:MAG TPA: PIN domain-containing protein [Bacteroidetes bacterium]|nr:PIN domain-containing protein [Bacteroidota bacterium]
MKKIFLDSDVLLDLLLAREPFIDDITRIVEGSLSSNIKLCVSSITVINIDYIIGRLETQNKAKTLRKKLLKIIYVENVGQSIISKASDSKFRDFEDAVQNYCAEESGHRIIITRNTKDYKESNLAIFTPKEYLAKIQTK